MNYEERIIFFDYTIYTTTSTHKKPEANVGSASLYSKTRIESKTRTRNGGFQ